jgi:septin family protein
MGNDNSKSSYSNILTLGIEESGKTTFVNNLISVYHPFVHEFFITEDFLNFFSLTNCIVNHILKDEKLSLKDKTSTENIKLLKQLKKGEKLTFT